MPELLEGQMLGTADTSIKEGTTRPPARFTENTLLLAMEHASAEDFAKLKSVPTKSSDFVGEGGAAEQASFSPQGGNERYGACDDAVERAGLGTPATRAGIIEKLIKSGMAVREKKLLTPTEQGMNLIRVIPPDLKSARLTAEWEEKLGEVERGTLDPAVFLSGITAMLERIVRDNRAAVSAAPPRQLVQRAVIGVCPRVKMTNLFSEKKGVLYDATVVMEDDGGKYVRFLLDFDRGKAG